MARLVAGTHHNPHGILGAHEYDDHTVIRAFRPHAVEVVALVGKDRFSLQHLDSGLFAVALPFVDLIDYRLQVTYEGCEPHTVADAYRFLPTLGEVDLHLFAEGRHERLWEVLGAHPRSFTTADGVVSGVSFAVWAPNAKGVSLIGEFNGWNGHEAPMRVLGPSGYGNCSGPTSLATVCTSSACTAPTAWLPIGPTCSRSAPRCRRRPHRG